MTKMCGFFFRTMLSKALDFVTRWLKTTFYLWQPNSWRDSALAAESCPTVSCRPPDPPQSLDKSNVWRNWIFVLFLHSVVLLNSANWAKGFCSSLGVWCVKGYAGTPIMLCCHCTLSQMRATPEPCYLWLPPVIRQGGGVSCEVANDFQKTIKANVIFISVIFFKGKTVKSWLYHLCNSLSPSPALSTSQSVCFCTKTICSPFVFYSHASVPVFVSVCACVCLRVCVCVHSYPSKASFLCPKLFVDSNLRL